MQVELNELKQQLADLKHRFDAQVNQLEQRITDLEKQPVEAPPNITPSLDTPHTLTHEEVITYQAPIAFQAPPSTDINQPTNNIKTSAAWTLLKAIFFALLGPFASLFEKTWDTYQSYRTEGRGPAFLMTAVGILTLVLGFGFLLQYSFQHFLNQHSKLAMSFIISIGIVLLGVRLAKKRPDMPEYSGSLIGLGIILNYLCAYFSTAQYQILGLYWGLTLLVLITLSAYLLAAYFETRIVAILTLIGGATTPLFLGDFNQISAIYFAYFTFLIITMLRLAYQIRWIHLMQLALIMVISMVEYLVLSHQPQWLDTLWYLFFLHAIFYLFNLSAYYYLSDARSQVNAQIVGLTTTNLLFFIFATYQTPLADNLLGWLYLANALFLSALFILHKRAPQTHKVTEHIFSSLFGLFIAILAGIGILYLLDPALIGLIWGLEALILIHLGFRFTLPTVRYEGYTAFAIALGQTLIHALPWMSANLLQYNDSLTSIHYDLDWMNMMVFGIIVWAAYTLMARNPLSEWEKATCYWLKELYSLWISLAFLFSFMVIWYNSLLLLSILPIFILLYRAKRHQLPLTETWALLHYALLIFQIFISAEHVDSFSFRAQDWIGKAIRIEAFLTLWLIAEFYSRSFPTGNYVKFAHTLRIVFYLLVPIALLPSIWKHQLEFFPLSLWVATIISVWLYYKLEYSALKTQFKLLMLMAFIATLMGSLVDYIQLQSIHAALALFTGIAFYLIILAVTKGFNRDKKHQQLIHHYLFLNHSAVYYLASVIFILSFSANHNLILSLSLTSVYFFSLCYFWPNIIPARKNIAFSYTLFMLSSCLASGVYWFEAGANNNLLFITLQTVLMGFLLHQRTPASRITWHLIPHLTQLILFNLYLVHTYFLLINAWFSHYETINLAMNMALVIHATGLLLLTLKPIFSKLIKLSIVFYAIVTLKIMLIDMDGFSLIQKVIAFMLIGSILLGASYLYQRLLLRHKT